MFLPEDQDYQYFKNECTTDEGWTICYDKSACRVATKKNSLSAFDVVRVRLYNSIDSNVYICKFRFKDNSVVYQVNYCMMLYMMVNIVQHGIQRC